MLTNAKLPTAAANSSPLVSIGLPVYNGAEFLREALDSLLRQTYPHFELIVSDNASEDQTPDICQEYAARDSRIRYRRQPANVGALKNFYEVLGQAAGDYFMWAAHDDRWEPAFIEENLRVLRANADVVVSISRVGFIGSNSWIWRTLWGRFGTAPLMQSVPSNVLRYLWHPGPPSRMYGLYRREVLARCLEGPQCWSADDAFMIRVLAHGKVGQVDRPLFSRRRGVSRAMADFVWRHNRTLLGRVFPYAEATENILAQRHVPASLLLYFFLAKLNVMHALWYYKSCLSEAWARWGTVNRGQPPVVPALFAPTPTASSER